MRRTRPRTRRAAVKEAVVNLLRITSRQRAYAEPLAARLLLNDIRSSDEVQFKILVSQGASELHVATKIGATRNMRYCVQASLSPAVTLQKVGFDRRDEAVWRNKVHPVLGRSWQHHPTTSGPIERMPADAGSA